MILRQEFQAGNNIPKFLRVFFFRLLLFVFRLLLLNYLINFNFILPSSCCCFFFFFSPCIRIRAWIMTRRRFRPKGTESTDLTPTTQLVRESLVFEVNMRTKHHSPKSTDDCLNYRCCEEWCNLFFSPMEVMQIRGAFIRSLKDRISRVDIIDAVVAFIHQRLELPVTDVGERMFSVVVRRRLFDKTVCQSFFVDVLGLTDSLYLRIIEDISNGRSFVSHRKGAVGQLGDRTCRAIARIANHLDLHGQFNPIAKHVMLGRGVDKLFFLRTNSTGSSLSEDRLREYTDLSIRRRGVDSFMRCDICLTLNAEFSKLSNLLRMSNEKQPSASRRASSYTRHAFHAHIRSKRKAVLYQLWQRYRKCRKERMDDPSNKLGINVDDVVPDEDIETSRYCKLLNARSDPKLPPFEITEEMIHASELLELDEDSIELYLSGVLGVDFSVAEETVDGEQLDMDDGASEVGDRGVGGGDAEDIPAEEDGGASAPGGGCGRVRNRLTGEDVLAGVDVSDMLHGDDQSAVVDIGRALVDAARLLPVNDVASRKRAGLLTAFEKLMALRKFHHEHITQERVLTYSAFEVAGMNMLSCLTFAADGLSKDKTMLPNKDKGKNDETVNRLDCFVTGLQMSVPQQVAAAPPTKTANRAERSRRKELDIRRRAMLKDPSAFTDEEKLEVERMLTEVADRDVAAASGFSLVNNDFLYPYGFGGPPKTDALISNILHVLRSDQIAFVPSCIALVLDNASVNKSIHTLRAFALLLELIPRLREVHLLFPTVGHTHNSVDAHFGTVCGKINKTEIGTPQELASCLETIPSTRAHIDFAYYVFADGLGKCSEAHEFKYLSHQHHFLIYRDNNGDVFFNNKAFLRFAEPLSHRVNHVLTKCRDLIPLTDEEMATGTPVFALGESGRHDRVDYAKTVFPSKMDPEEVDMKSAELLQQLRVAGMATNTRYEHLESLRTSAVPDISLYDLCREINLKQPTTEEEILYEGTDQEHALALFLRMRGRQFRSSEMAATVANAHTKAMKTLTKTLLPALLEGDDDGSLRKEFLAKLEVYEKRKGSTKFPLIIAYLKSPVAESDGDDGDHDLMDVEHEMTEMEQPRHKRRRRDVPMVMHEDEEDDFAVFADADDVSEVPVDDEGEDSMQPCSSRGRRIKPKKQYTPSSDTAPK